MSYDHQFIDGEDRWFLVVLPDDGKQLAMGIFFIGEGGAVVPSEL
jgi:hypothetical protein